MNKTESLEEKRERLKKYREAEEKILNGQSYALGSKQLTRTNLAKVQDMIAKLEAEIETIERYGTTKRRSRRVVPVD